MNFIIRQAEHSEDWDFFYSLSFETLKVLRKSNYDQLVSNNPNKSDIELLAAHRKEMEEYFDFENPTARVFVAVTDDGVWCGYLWMGERNSDEYLDFQRPQWIYDIVVDPRFRGNGLGKNLMQQAEEFATKLEQNIGLFVHENNESAIGLYKSLNYYFKGVPMHKSLEKVSTETEKTDFMIRKEIEDDLSSIKQLGLKRFKQMVRLSKDVENDQISVKYDEYLKDFDSADNKHCRFVAEIDGNIVGFVWIGVAGFNDKVGLFYDLVIVEKHKGLGLEVTLLNHAEVWTKNSGLASIYYLLHVQSDITEDFLKSQGYSVPGYFMEKDLVRKI